MGSLRFLAIGLLLASPALAQTYGVGRPTTPAELTRLDISIGPTGEELPVGHGTPKEGEEVQFQSSDKDGKSWAKWVHVGKMEAKTSSQSK